MNVKEYSKTMFPNFGARNTRTLKTYGLVDYFHATVYRYFIFYTM
jgi:hypothetical protein